LAFLVSLYIYVADTQQLESLARSFSKTWFIHRVLLQQRLDEMGKHTQSIPANLMMRSALFLVAISACYETVEIQLTE
jgi:hypothetical protein